LRIPLKIIADNRADGREGYQATYVLVRPDQFVGWASEDQGVDAPTILRRLTGANESSLLRP